MIGFARESSFPTEQSRLYPDKIQFGTRDYLVLHRIVKLCKIHAVSGHAYRKIPIRAGFCRAFSSISLDTTLNCTCFLPCLGYVFISAESFCKSSSLHSAEG